MPKDEETQSKLPKRPRPQIPEPPQGKIEKDIGPDSSAHTGAQRERDSED